MKLPIVLVFLLEVSFKHADQSARMKCVTPLLSYVLRAIMQSPTNIWVSVSSIMLQWLPGRCRGKGWPKRY